MNGIHLYSIQELSTGYASGALDPVTVMKQTLDHMNSVNDKINAIAWCDPALAIQQAEESAQRWKQGTQRGLMDGVPVTVKDAIDMKDTQSTFGSAVYADVPKAEVDSPPVARLKEAGAIIFAKTTAPDSGMAITGLSSLYGVVRNPWDLNNSPGGSSAGAGATLASGIGTAAVGTDLAGSVRIPAARCGLATLKPTQGRIAHTPPNTIRSPGAMGRSIADVIALHEVIGQPDMADTHSLPKETRTFQSLPQNLNGLSIGVLPNIGCGNAADPEVLHVLDQAVEALILAGADIKHMPIVFDQDPLPALERTFQIRLRAELEAFDGCKDSLMLPELAEWAQSAQPLSATDYYRALSEVGVAQRKVQKATADFDFVLAPVVPDAQLQAEQRIDPVHPFINAGFTAWFNQTGQPAASVCFGMHNGSPIGIQIIGQRFDDLKVLAMAEWFEKHRNFEMQWPLQPRSLVETR